MPQFLTTTGVSFLLEEIIKGARSQLYLISPYLKFNPRIREFLEGKADEKICDIRVIYGKSDLKPEESGWLNKSDIRTSYCENLHAKCYLNESAAILTSMNLYLFSQQNNNEMGILVRKEEDPELYGDILKEAQRLLKASKRVLLTVEEVPEDDLPKKSPAKPKQQRKPRKKERKVGFCIACGNPDHPFGPNKPLCFKCYKKSHQGKDLADYKDRVCHSCGNKHPSLVERPLCYACYKAVG